MQTSILCQQMSTWAKSQYFFSAASGILNYPVPNQANDRTWQGIIGHWRQDMNNGYEVDVQTCGSGGELTNLQVGSTSYLGCLG